MADVQVIPTENGPYKVTGPIELVDPEGNPIAVPGKTVFLCRCGGSTNKPFCDGTHSKIGFQGAMAAVAGAGEAES
jgi:CDGSH-type Zn-finger protein